jgi:hypothetical protein
MREQDLYFGRNRPSAALDRRCGASSLQIQFNPIVPAALTDLRANAATKRNIS